jgi:L-ribulose-5-phosphate 3-epimerase UlaE
MVIVKNRVDKIRILPQNRVKIYIERIDQSYLTKIVAIRVYKHITRINQPYFRLSPKLSINNTLRHYQRTLVVPVMDEIVRDLLSAS